MNVFKRIKAGWVLMWILCLGAPAGAYAGLAAALEGPFDNQTVSGIGVIRGWAFSDTAGVQIQKVTLTIDGEEITAIPCCSERADVEDSFPQFPEANTRNSGYGITFNFNILAPGVHTVAVGIQDTSGADFRAAHTVTVVKPGDFEFVDRVDLSAANVERQGQDIVLNGVRVRDKAGQQEKSSTVRLRWFQNTQMLGMVETASSAGLNDSPPSTSAAQSAAFEKAQTGDATGIRLAALESPNDGDTGSGIAVIRGWAIAPVGRTIARVQLFIDGEPFMTLPCCSRRADVAGAFPDEPNAANSGFGVTFNYGNLATGIYSLTVEVEDSSGSVRTFTRGIVVRNPGNFRFLENLDFGSASVSIAGGQLAISNALAQDRATGQALSRSLRYRWDVPAQNFLLVDEGIRDVTITNHECAVNGDISNLDALLNNPGPDGISLAELLAAVNAVAPPGRVLADFSAGGTIQCKGLLSPVRGPLTLNGDVNGDSIPDVLLNGVLAGLSTAEASTQAENSLSRGLEIVGNDVTIRGFSLVNFAESAVFVSPSGGNEIANIAILENDIAQTENGILIGTADGAKRVRDILISENRIGNTSTGIDVQACCSAGANLARITLANNNLENFDNDGIIIGPNNARNSTFRQISIVGNTIKSARNEGILLTGGFNQSENNLLESVIRQNSVSNANIKSVGGFNLSNGNTIITDIEDNLLERSADSGIFLGGGVDNSTHNSVNAKIKGNISSFDGNGISISGGINASSQNQIITDVRGNEMRNSIYAGILMEGGSDSIGNTVEGSVMENTVASATEGVVLAGGFEKASNNLLKTDVQKNFLNNSQNSGVLMAGGWSATANVLNAVVTDNSVSDSSSGIFVCGGTTRQRDNNSGSANNNSALVAIIENTVQRSSDTGIAVFGGCDAVAGVVNDNQARASILNNQVDSIDCQNKIIGNTAECTVSNNANALAKTRSGNRPSIKNGAPNNPIPSLIVRRILDHRSRVKEREKRLRVLASETEDIKLSKRLLQFSDRLRVLDTELNDLVAGSSSD